MGIFSFLGFGNSLKEQLRKGGTIVDVRTVHEYDQGRMKGSVNIPLERIPSSIERIKYMEKPLLICGSGDSRSASAARFLKKNGITEVYDGGNWEKLLRIKQSL
jgi:phage shock protein E